MSKEKNTALIAAVRNSSSEVAVRLIAAKAGLNLQNMVI